VDQLPLNEKSDLQKQIKWHTIDLNKKPELPFEDNYFSVVTLLAVVEHLNPQSMASLFVETYRVLQPGGMVRQTFAFYVTR
jgi:ubiquinone/menaquinone biosynthesis C-methylase UbiE